MGGDRIVYEGIVRFMDEGYICIYVGNLNENGLVLW